MNIDKNEIIEYIMQLKISNFIKQNRNMNKKELAQKVDEILRDKEKMYNMNEKELEEILKNKE